MNRRRVLALVLTIIVMIVSVFALFFNKNHKKATSIGEVKYEDIQIIEPLQEEMVRRAAYISELEKLELNVTNKESWFKEYKKIQEEYLDVVDKHPTIYEDFTKNEIELLFRVVQAEIGHYSFEQICNVASVIFNRVDDGRFGYSLNGVLNPGQFGTISSGAIYRYTVSERVKLACEYVYMFGDTTGGALFFHSNTKSDTFSGYPYRFSDGAHHFY